MKNMNKEEALKLIAAGSVTVWNKYREENPDWKPDLSYEDLSGGFLYYWTNEKIQHQIYFDFSGANLCGTKFPEEEEYMTKNIGKAIFNADTIFPAGFDPIERGAEFVTNSQLKRTDFAPTPTVFIQPPP